MLAETFRSTLASILFSSDNASSPCIMVVTSCSPMAGKTTVTSNLGIALSEINRRVLLIDADLRKPRLQYVFNVENRWGLTDLLRDSRPVDEYPLENLALPTEVPGLSVLPGGTSRHSIANLLFSPRLPQLLRRLRRDFDAVLIDTPPMLQISDARILGRLSDGVILVFFANHTSRDAAMTAVERLREDRIPVLGTILNHWDPKKSPSHLNYYEGYYRYYESRQAKGSGETGETRVGEATRVESPEASVGSETTVERLAASVGAGGKKVERRERRVERRGSRSERREWASEFELGE